MQLTPTPIDYLSKGKEDHSVAWTILGDSTEYMIASKYTQHVALHWNEQAYYEVGVRAAGKHRGD